MKLKKLSKKLNELFGASSDNVSQAQERLEPIIAKLEEKKNSIKEKMQLAGEEDETSKVYRQLEKEYKVASKLLKKARQNYSRGSESDDSQAGVDQ